MTEKTGLPRLLEALEANEWSSTAEPHDSGDSSGDSEFNDPLFSAGLDSDVRSVDFDVPELRTALIDKQKAERGEEQKDGERGGEDGDAQVRELESMMMKMQAVKGICRLFLSLVPSSAFPGECHLLHLYFMGQREWGWLIILRSAASYD